jgi:hypothetical protein
MVQSVRYFYMKESDFQNNALRYILKMVCIVGDNFQNILLEGCNG